MGCAFVGNHTAGCSGLNRHRRLLWLLMAALSLVLSSTAACRKKARVPHETTVRPIEKTEPGSLQAITPPTPEIQSTPEEDPASQKAVLAPKSFELGEQKFQAGDFKDAARYFEEYLKTRQKSPNRDEALFYLVVLHTLPNNPGRSSRRAEEALKQLKNEFPKNPYKDAAQLIMDLQMQVQNFQLDIKSAEERINQLNEELKKLKEIDLNRQPSKLPR